MEVEFPGATILYKLEPEEEEEPIVYEHDVPPNQNSPLSEYSNSEVAQTVPDSSAKYLYIVQITQL